MGNKTVYEEDTNEENEKKNCFFVSVILAGNIFTASMGNLQVNAAEATVGAESREMAEASVVIGLEISGTSPYNGVFLKTLLYRSEAYYLSHAARGMYVSFLHDDGSKSNAIRWYNWEDNGIRPVLREEETGEELPLDDEWVEEGDYRFLVQYGSITEKVMDLSVKAPGECADYTMKAGETIECANIGAKVSVIKVTVEENAVYYLHYGEGSDSAANIIFVRDNEGKALSFSDYADQDHPARLYLREGENYLYLNPRSSMPATVSLEKKVISGLAMSKSPAEDQSLISTDEIGSVNDLWNLHSKLHDQMAFSLRYQDGTSEELSYEEFGKLWNYSIVKRRAEY